MSAVQDLPYDACVLKEKTPERKASMFFCFFLCNFFIVVEVFLAEVVVVKE